MKEVVVISGKGGTGKTSITASFAYLGGKEVVIADCDVDASDMHLLLQPDFAMSENFFSGSVAEIIQDDCIQCGYCDDVCRFNAVTIIDDKYFINPLNCEGCGYCPRVCPTDAIKMEKSKAGKWYISETKTGSTMVHAKLGIGADNSGKLVAEVKAIAKKIAKKNYKELIVVDGSPGIGCPVVSSLSGADFVVLITEPTVSGLHDLKRVYELINTFKLKAGCIINKYDLNNEITNQIKQFLKSENIIHITDLPYNENFTKAMLNGKTIVEYDNGKLKSIITKSWETIKTIINN